MNNSFEAMDEMIITCLSFILVKRIPRGSASGYRGKYEIHFTEIGYESYYLHF